ncbi:unnamed protein product [Parascedosporium putredinis]|uniref:GH16 domain-containing protein n=1 Tax=Parascedosporium putredinis TaxID=1442378 RepID=A0A9P1GVY8_9PEZI|nr:unnamed protein product [Parascedosporium putredinis]CAI7988326.1 unnamed protein product [Parascedosporium putredinis]
MVPTAAVSPARPGTPLADAFENEVDPVTNPGSPSLRDPHDVSPGANPFISPDASLPASSFDESNRSVTGAGRPHPEDTTPRYFYSRRVKKGDVEKPWLKRKDPKEKWVTILPILGILVGLGIAGFLVWDGINSVVKHQYCEVLYEDFSQGLRDSIWSKEVELGGFGNGEFGMTTTDEQNIFLQDGHLVIRATLQDSALIEKDTVLNLTSQGICTSDLASRCVAVTNTTIGNSSIVPPALTARINTRNGPTIKYGRVEVTAKLPVGDWLWPAIWMMPVNSVYGEWPASGEIDIMESRGNNWTKRAIRHSTYSKDFNTFGLEWSQKYLFTYVNSRLLQVMYTNFAKSFWERGNFPDFDAEGQRIEDPWSRTGRAQTPFDQDFFLILNVAVGSQNGWFEDAPGKPWRDGSPNAAKDFWENRDAWYPTWTQPEMVVSKVVMWQQCNGNEEL